MLQLPSGVRLDGDRELVYRVVDDEQASGDGLYLADIVEASGLPEDSAGSAVRALLDAEVLAEQGRDDQLGPRFVKGRSGL